MTPATLRKLEWAGEDAEGFGYCLVCHADAGAGRHAPDCELDAAIRKAEQAEKGERPEIQVGDWVLETDEKPPNPFVCEVTAHNVGTWNRYEGGVEIRGERNGRPFLWRQEPPTHD